MSSKPPTSYSSVIANFCDGTSIRGLRRAVLAEHRFVRIFWTLFVFFSGLSVVYIGSFCIKAYTQYQTVVIRHKRAFVGQDFPSVTLCSDAFMGDTEDARILTRHPIIYQEYVDQLFNNASKAKRFDVLANLRLLRTTVMYNLNNVDVWTNLSRSFLTVHLNRDEDQLTRNHSSIFCSIANHESFGDCKISVFYDLRYRNCLSFTTLVKQSQVRTEEMRLVVSFLADDNPSIFYADPYVGNNVLLGPYAHVFLHESTNLPRSSPTFALSLKTHQWGVIDFDSVLSVRLKTPRSQCDTSPQYRISHADQPLRLTEHTCRGYSQRIRTRDNCSCEPWWPPFEQWPLKAKSICGSLSRGLEQALKDLRCMGKIEKGPNSTTDHDSLVTCVEPCTRRHYDPHIHSNVLDMTIYENMIREHQLMEQLRSMAEDCTMGSKNRHGPSHTDCHKLHGFVNDIVANEVKETDPGADGDLHYSKHEGWKNTTALWRSVFPNFTTESLHKQSKTSKLKKRFLYLVIRPMAKYIEVDEESLVWTTGTTVAQLGGASSFLAGVSFIVFGEMIELLYSLFKIPRKTAKLERPVQNGTEEEATTIKVSDI